MNVSTFIGQRIAGIPGAVAATGGFITVPFLIIILISLFLRNFASIPLVQHAFAGIRVCVCVLIFDAVRKLWKSAMVDVKSLILYIVILILALFSKYLPVSVPMAVLVLASGLFGILFCRKKEDEK